MACNAAAEPKTPRAAWELADEWFMAHQYRHTKQVAETNGIKQSSEVYRCLHDFGFEEYVRIGSDQGDYWVANTAEGSFGFFPLTGTWAKLPGPQPGDAADGDKEMWQAFSECADKIDFRTDAGSYVVVFHWNVAKAARAGYCSPAAAHAERRYTIASDGFIREMTTVEDQSVARMTFLLVSGDRAIVERTMPRLPPRPTSGVKFDFYEAMRDENLLKSGAELFMP